MAKIVLLLIIFIHLFLLSKLTFFPYPELFVYPYLTEAGLVPYKDILDQHFPGVMFFSVNLASLGIDTPLDMRAVQFFLVTISHVLLFAISAKIFKNNYYALISNVLFALWSPVLEGYVLWIDSFSQVLLLASFYFAVNLEKRNLFKFFLLGFTLGASLLLKQVVLPLTGLLFIYFWLKYKSINILMWYLAGIAVPVIFLIIFVVNRDIFSDFYFWTVQFNLTTFADMGRKYASITEIVNIFPIFGFAIITLLFFWLTKKLDKVILLSIFFLGALVFAYARFDFVHLQPALPFSILLILSFFDFVKKQQKILLVFVFILISVTFTGRQYPRLFGNNVLFFGDDEKIVSEKIKNISSEGDKIFAFGTLPHIYQMADRLPPGNVFVFQFPWFMKEAEERVLNGIVLEPPKVVIRDQSAEVAGINLVNYMSKINGYINDNYKTAYRVGGIEIMVPRKI